MAFHWTPGMPCYIYEDLEVTPRHTVQTRIACVEAIALWKLFILIVLLKQTQKKRLP